MRLIYTLMLVGVTAVWGWTFVVVQDAINAYGVLGFLSLRFLLAGAALAPFLLPRMTLRTLLVGAGIGLTLAAGYLFQTLGLLYTTPTNSGLITGLFVVFAPLTAWAFFKVRIPRPVVLAILLSLSGMALLAGQSASLGRVGDALTVLCAAGLGAHIALLSRYAPDHDAGALALAQMLSMAALFTVLWPAFEPVVVPPREVWFAILLTGLVASAGAFYVQTTVQQRIPAARAAIILTMEPVFAAIFGYWLAGDRLSAVQLSGGVLILSALFIGEVLPVLRRRGK
ncbi:MAG: DMT family transporter [Actinomycetota bacterium]|nr:DMT family transporter [Actinomycetota bacterium]